MQVTIWKVTSQQPPRVFGVHSWIVHRLAWSLDGRLLVCGGGSRDKGEMFVWETQSEERIDALQGLAGMVYAAIWHSVGNQLISGGSGGRLRRSKLQHVESVQV